ncbi:MAG TPA: hypothetical protein VNN79_09355 [Actinomycetota bacterium]|nr:hypothetical protein [Actinomycetota bacterium]
MNDVVTSYRLTPSDLSGLDSKTRAALLPLIESLNVVIQQLVKRVNAATHIITPVTSFTTSNLGAVYVDILNPLTTVPRGVIVSNIYRNDGVPIDGGYGFWWTMTTSGIRLLFVGLVALTRYNFSVDVIP